MDRETEGERVRRGKRARDARGKGIPPIQGCRQEGCSSSAINLTCTMAERARSRSSLDEESQAGIISFVHRLPGEIPLTGRAEELAEASVSAAAATTPRSGNKRSLCLLFHASARAYVRAVEKSRVLRSAQCAHPGSSRPSIAPSSRRTPSKKCGKLITTLPSTTCLQFLARRLLSQTYCAT